LIIVLLVNMGIHQPELVMPAIQHVKLAMVELISIAQNVTKEG
jgi:hypothetical protein